MDLVDIIAEKRWLGQEFLTWLWYKSEERGGSIEIAERGDIIVSFEKHMLLESGQGESLEKITCTGLQAGLKEARTGLQIGKKLEQARIVLESGNMQYAFTLSGSMMEFRSVKLPATENTEVSGSDPEELEGMILERIYLFEELTKVVNQLFAMFMEIRLNETWREELSKICQWIEKNAEVVSSDLSD